uniref:GAT domain-containing protein n=1 Tax=Panagrellus redivivus TaxID=6233 RepID=A0A7E4UT09_PANRE
MQNLANAMEQLRAANPAVQAEEAMLLVEYESRMRAFFDLSRELDDLAGDVTDEADIALINRLRQRVNRLLEIHRGYRDSLRRMVGGQRIPGYHPAAEAA